MANFCMLNSEGGPVTVKVVANNGLRTRALFWLWEPQGDTYIPVPADQHNGATGDIGVWIFNLNTSVGDLDGKVLTWTAKSCLFIPGTERATLKIEFLQGTAKCETTVEYYANRKYPQCSSGNDQPQPGDITFKLFNNQPIEMLWERMI